MTTSIETVKESEKLGRPCLIPLVFTIDGCADPAKVFFGIKNGFSYLLESAAGPREAARYSVIGCNPLFYLKVDNGGHELRGHPDFVESAELEAKKVKNGRDALDLLRAAGLFNIMKVSGTNTRYLPGAVGYLSYDFVRSLVDIGSRAEDDLHQPELEFMVPKQMIIFDHLSKLTHYCSLIFLVEGSDPTQEHEKALAELKDLKKAATTQPIPPQRKVKVSSNFNRSTFEQGVKRIKQYIRAGDVIQTVLSRRIELNPVPILERFYMELRQINPSPYMFFLNFPGRAIVGSSPELLVKVDGNQVTTRPIAGTRKRGSNPSDDIRMKQELLGDEKERAEHVMLVDLGRNDLGKVSKFGTVKVTDFMRVEQYSHVQHLVTDVVGKLKEGKNAFDALRAAFPAGTVTGAPKVRAMEIIEELEPVRRGIYAGAVGSFTYTGDADLAITIRTLVAEQKRGWVQVGAGVVADSVPWKEYYETENKARALLIAAGV